MTNFTAENPRYPGILSFFASAVLSYSFFFLVLLLFGRDFPDRLLEALLYSVPYTLIIWLARGRLQQMQLSEQKLESYRALVELSSDWIWEVDDQLRYTFASPVCRTMLGYDPEELIGRTPLELMEVEEAERVRKIMASVIAERRSFKALINRNLRKDGTPILLETSGRPILDADGRFLGYRGVDRDISDVERINETLLMTQKVFDQTLEGIAVSDREGTILRVNPAFTEITGYSAEEAVGQNPRILKSDHHDAEFYTRMWDQLLNRGFWEGEIWNRNKQGEAYPEWLSISAIYDEEGRIKNFISLFHDITEKKSNEEQLRYLAFHDALTGLPNRNLLNDRLLMSLAAAGREESSVAVCFFDLDNFKYVNDTLGHPAGDRLLQLVRERVGQICRAEDTFARYGGDEFVLVLPGMGTPDDAVSAVKRLLALFNEPFELKGKSMRIGTSVGIALFPADGTDATSLFKRADMALYTAKEAGKGTYAFYQRSLNQEFLRRRGVESELADAIDAQELELVYQPKYRLKDGELIGFESLIRWRRNGTLVPPSEFIPAAEQSNLIFPIGKLVVKESLDFCRQVRAASGRDLSVSVNFSAKQFQRGEHLREILELTDQTELPLSALILEITESVLMKDIAYTAKVLRDLSSRGVRISIDDFGTGYSSFQYLRELPVGEIKIDKLFIAGLPSRKYDLTIVRSILAIARNLELDVVAEGIETKEQELFLKEHGCLLGQGFYFSRPLERRRALELVTGVTP